MSIGISSERSVDTTGSPGGDSSRAAYTVIRNGPAITRPDAGPAPETAIGRGVRQSAAEAATGRREVLRLIVRSALVNGGHILLVGEKGTGKTAILDALTTAIPASRATFVRLSGDISASQLERVVALAYRSLLLKRRRPGGPIAGGGILLLLDDADNLAEPALAALEKLIDELGGYRVGPRFVVAGRPELLTRVRAGGTDRIASRFESIFTLPSGEGGMMLSANADLPAAEMRDHRHDQADHDRPPEPPAPDPDRAAVTLAGPIGVRGRRGYIGGCAAVIVAVSLAGVLWHRARIAPSAPVSASRRDIPPVLAVSVPPRSARVIAAPEFAKLPIVQVAPEPSGALAVHPFAATTRRPTTVAPLPAPAEPRLAAILPRSLSPVGPPPERASAFANLGDAVLVARPVPRPPVNSQFSPPATLSAASNPIARPRPVTAPLQQPPPRAAPGLLLVAAPGDTLPALFQQIYKGVTPPSYTAFVAANPAPIVAGSRITAPAPPGGWVRR